MFFGRYTFEPLCSGKDRRSPGNDRHWINSEFKGYAQSLVFVLKSISQIGCKCRPTDKDDFLDVPLPQSLFCNDFSTDINRPGDKRLKQLFNINTFQFIFKVNRGSRIVLVKDFSFNVNCLIARQPYLGLFGIILKLSKS